MISLQRIKPETFHLHEGVAVLVTELLDEYRRHLGGIVDIDIAPMDDEHKRRFGLEYCHGRGQSPDSTCAHQATYHLLGSPACSDHVQEHLLEVLAPYREVEVLMAEAQEAGLNVSAIDNARWGGTMWRCTECHCRPEYDLEGQEVCLGHAIKLLKEALEPA